MNINLSDFIQGIISREVKKLYLTFLYTLEDLREKNQISEDEFQRLRKRVLDYGNNCYRNIDEQLNNFDFNLKKN
jgi:ferredoxin-fold anticodon binding domain-containing protein